MTSVYQVYLSRARSSHALLGALDAAHKTQSASTGMFRSYGLASVCLLPLAAGWFDPLVRYNYPRERLPPEVEAQRRQAPDASFEPATALGRAAIAAAASIGRPPMTASPRIPPSSGGPRSRRLLQVKAPAGAPPPDRLAL